MSERDDELERAFYDAFYAGMYVVPYDDAPTALKLRLRLALELVDGLRGVRSEPVMVGRSRTVKVQRKAA